MSKQALLIERLVETVLIDLCTPIPLSPDEVRARLAAALGPDVIVIDREQARETIARALTAFDARDQPSPHAIADTYWTTRLDAADAIIAALAGEEADHD